jgi:hypothetical protein
MLWLLYSQERTHWIRFSMSGRCCIFRQSVPKNLTRFLSVRSGDKQWKAIYPDVASISKARVVLLAYKQLACCAVRKPTNWSKAAVTNNHCLSFMGISLCHTHLPTTQLECWSYNELNSKLSLSWYSNKGICSFIIFRCYWSQISWSEISSSVSWLWGFCVFPDPFIPNKR